MEHFMSVVTEQDITSRTDLILKCSCGWDKTFGSPAFPVASLEELSDAASSHIEATAKRKGAGKDT